MTHETDIERLTLELRHQVQAGLIRANREQFWDEVQLAVFWVAVGGIVGTLLAIGYLLRH